MRYFIYILALLFLLSGCKKDYESYQEPYDRDYMIIYQEANAKLCESKFFYEALVDMGIESPSIKSYDKAMWCDDFGREQGESCSVDHMRSINTKGNSSCVIGFDRIKKSKNPLEW